MLPLVAPSAVIELTFDPIVTVGDLSVRLETLGVALAIFVGLVLAALVARRTPVDTTRPADAPGDEPGEPTTCVPTTCCTSRSRPSRAP